MRPKKVILCVDDNEQELSVLKFMLETNGYRVLTAQSGQDAIAVFRNAHVDLVLADFVMQPEMNGAQLVLRLKKIASHIPVILLGDPETLGNEVHGADAMYKKSSSVLDLLARLRIMSQRKRGPRKGTLPANREPARKAAAS